MGEVPEMPPIYTMYQNTFPIEPLRYDTYMKGCWALHPRAAFN